MIATSKTSIIKSLVASIMITIGLVAFAEQIPKKNGYDTRETTSSCPGLGTCTKVQTPKNDTCTSCPWYYVTWKCGCKCSPDIGVKITSIGNCVLEEWGEFYKVGGARCVDYIVTEAEAVPIITCT